MELFVRWALRTQNPAVEIAARECLDHERARCEIPPTKDRCTLRTRVDRTHTRKELHSIIRAVLTSEDERNLLAMFMQSGKFVERRRDIRPRRDVIVVAIAALDLAEYQSEVLLVAAQHVDRPTLRC